MAMRSEGDAPMAASTDLFLGVASTLADWSAAGAAVASAEAKSGAARARRTENIWTSCTHAELSHLLVHALVWCDDGSLYAVAEPPIEVAPDGARSLVCRASGGELCRIRLSEVAGRACTFLPGVAKPSVSLVSRMGLQARLAFDIGEAADGISRVTSIRLTVEGICEAAPVTPAELGDSLGMTWVPFEREVTKLDAAALSELVRRMGARPVPVDGAGEVSMLIRELGSAAGWAAGSSRGDEEVSAAALAQLAFGLSGLSSSEAMAVVALGATTVASIAGKEAVARLPPLSVAVSEALRQAKAIVGAGEWPQVMLSTVQQLLGVVGPLATAPPPRRMGAALRAVLHSRLVGRERCGSGGTSGVRADFGLLGAEGAGGGARPTVGPLGADDVAGGSSSFVYGGASESAHMLSPVSRLERELAAAREAKRARLPESVSWGGAAVSSASVGGGRLPLALTMAAAAPGPAWSAGGGGMPRVGIPEGGRGAGPSFAGFGGAAPLGRAGPIASPDPPPLGDFHGSQFSVAFLPVRVSRMGPGEALRAIGVNVSTLAARFSAIARSGKQDADDVFDGLPPVPDDGLALEAAADYARALATGMVLGWVDPPDRPADDQTAIQRLRSFYRSAAARSTPQFDKGNAGVCELRALDKEKASDFTARMQAMSPSAVASITTRAVRVQEELVDATGRAEPLIDARRQVDTYGGAAVAYLTSSRRTDGLMAGELIEGRPAPAMVPASFERNRVGLVGAVVARLEEFQGRDRVFSKAVGPKLGERISTFAASFVRGDVDVAEAVRLMGGEPSRPGAINQAVVFRSADKATLMGRDGVDHTDPRFPEDFKRAMQRLEALTVDIIGRALGASYAQRVLSIAGLESSGSAHVRGHFDLAPDPLSGAGGDTLLDKCMRLDPSERVRVVQRCFEHLNSLMTEQRHSAVRVQIDLCECQRVAAQLVEGDSSMAGLAVQRLLRQELDRRGVKEKAGGSSSSNQGSTVSPSPAGSKVTGKSKNKSPAPAPAVSGGKKPASPDGESGGPADSATSRAPAASKVHWADEAKATGFSGKRVPKSLEAGSPAAAIWAQVAAGQKAESLDIKEGTFTSLGELHTLYMTMMAVEKGLQPSAKLGDTAPCFWEAVIADGCRQAATAMCARCRMKSSWEPVPPAILMALKSGATAHLRDRMRGVKAV